MIVQIGIGEKKTVLEITKTKLWNFAFWAALLSISAFSIHQSGEVNRLEKEASYYHFKTDAYMNIIHKVLEATKAEAPEAYNSVASRMNAIKAEAATLGQTTENDRYSKISYPLDSSIIVVDTVK